jgi:hypothetical protein
MMSRENAITRSASRKPASHNEGEGSPPGDDPARMIDNTQRANARSREPILDYPEMFREPYNFALERCGGFTFSPYPD